MLEFTFEPDVEFGDVMMEDIENQIVSEAVKRYGLDKTGDDIKDYKIKLTVKVTMKEE